MSDLTITKRSVNGVVVLDLVGKVRLGDGNIDIHRTLRSLVEQNEKKVLLNLSGVSSIDSSGLGELVAGYTTLEKSGGELKLLGLTDRVSELMMITKLLTVFDVHEKESTAIASFEPDDERVPTQPLNQNGNEAETAA